MSADGTRLLDEGMTVYTGPVAEGTKIFKKDRLLLSLYSGRRSRYGMADYPPLKKYIWSL